MSVTGCIFWTLCLWIPFLMCFEDFCQGNDVSPKKAMKEYTDAFKSRFPKAEPISKEE